jgi:tetratricopeptide (TPR) repeat protein
MKALGMDLGRSKEGDAVHRPSWPRRMAGRWTRLVEGFRSSSSKSKKALLLVLLAGTLPWIVAYAFLLRLRHQDRDREMAEPLRQAQVDLAAAEEARRDPALPRPVAGRSASFALSGFRQALFISAGDSREAWLGAGRSYEILSEDGLAEEHYRKAEPLPAARLGLSRIWLRRFFDGDRTRDWRGDARARVLKLAPGRPEEEPEVLRAYLEGRWDATLSGGVVFCARDPGNDVMVLAVALAALELGKFDEALRALDLAERLPVTRATLHYYRGLSFAKEGQKERAREAFTAALEAAPPSWGFSLEAQVHRDRLGR